VVIIASVLSVAIASVCIYITATIVAERITERKYKADPDAFFEKERQDTDKYDIPALLAKMEEKQAGEGDG